MVGRWDVKDQISEGEISNTGNAMRTKMESLFDKTALVVNKSEELNAEDRVSIEYQIMFIVEENGVPAHPHTTFAVNTDDKILYDKFIVGKKANLKILQDAIALLRPVKMKAN
jgi:hypothetical protein